MTKRPASHAGRIRVPGLLLVLVCFFLSGITGLAYEILWVRLLERVIGAAPFAISIVLAVFMGGLGLGSYLASRWIDRVKPTTKLVRWYGIFELGIGLYALAIPLLLPALQPVYAWLYALFFKHFLLFNAATCIFCGSVLLLPTILMGATLPMLCRYAISTLDEVGTRVGLFYGLNTLGAAAGALLTGMVWLPKFGMTGTLWLSVVLNCAVGLTCLLWVRGKTTVVEEVRKPARRPDAMEEPKAILPDTTTRLILLVFVISGFSSMAYEVIWTQLLGLIVGPTTYSFTIVLVTFITGLALGSIVFGKLSDKTARPELLLLWTQLGAAAGVLFGSQFLGGSQLFFAKLLFTYQDSFAGQQAMKALALFGVMVWPTLCLGAAFPLVGKLLTRSRAVAGRTLGVSYALNTVGCVAGSLAAGFFIVPYIGKEQGLSLVAGLQILSVLVVGWWCLRRNARPRLMVSAAAVAGLALCFLLPRWNHLYLASSKYHRLPQFLPLISKHGWLAAAFKGNTLLEQCNNGKLLYYGEGAGGFTTVLGYWDVYGNPTLSLANSGKFDASTDGDMKTQVLLAHIPLLIHPHPEQVMVLGLGSGITGGEALYYSSVKKVDILEIGEQVVAASRLFTNYNNRVLEDPRTQLIIQDARAHLALSGRSYDVIISEPSNPWMAGMASLFTEEFFHLARTRLNPGGIYIQFIHTYEIDWPSFSMVTRTFNKVFPGAIMLASDPGRNGSDYLLVGAVDGKAGLNVETARTKAAAFRQSKNMQLSDPALLYRLLVTEDLGSLSGDGPLNTEDKPLLEFNAPRSLYSVDESLPERIRAHNGLTPESGRIADLLADGVEAQLQYAEFALSLGVPFARMINEQRATEKQRRRYEGMIIAYCQHHPLDVANFAGTSLMKTCLDSQIAVLEPRKASLEARGLAYLADLYFQSGLKTNAFETFRAALVLDPNNVRALNGLGAILGDENKHAEAIGYFKHVLEINPFQPEAYLNLGITYLEIDDKSRAQRYFQKALELDPSSEQARRGLELATSRR